MAYSVLKLQREVERKSLENNIYIAKELKDPSMWTENEEKDVLKVETILAKLATSTGRLEGIIHELGKWLEKQEGKEELLKFEEETNLDLTLISETNDCMSELKTIVFRFERMERYRKVKPEQAEHEGSTIEGHLKKMVELLEQTNLPGKKPFLSKSAQLQNMNPESTSIKLPKLELEAFDGNILRWCQFWEIYDSTIHKNSFLSNIEKFSYLRNKLSGDALLSISGLSLSSENYDSAVMLLKERFGDVHTVINAHYSHLMDLPTIDPKLIPKLEFCTNSKFYTNSKL